MSDAQSTTTTYDVVIVGAGTAGIPCAIEAAAGGAKVCVVESQDRIGGTLHVTGGDLSGAGTRAQARAGIEDDPDAHWNDLQRLSRGTVDPVVARMAVDGAAETIDWLDDLGYRFADDAPAVLFGHEPYDTARTHFSPDRGLEVLRCVEPLWDAAVADGGITVLFEHRMVRLDVDDDGAVTGVVVETPDGAERTVRGRSVALTTGGYAANKAMFEERTPQAHPVTLVAPPTSQGDGIVAAEALGAAFRGADLHLATADGMETSAGSGRADLLQAWPILHDPLRPPREIYVTSDGRRFMNEEELSPDTRERIMVKLPDAAFFVVFDESTIDSGQPLVPFWGTDGLRAAAREGGVAWVGDTLAELAERAGIDPDGLEETVRRFNEAVPTGDDEFGRRRGSHLVKEPPFYALRNVATMFISFGGLVVDQDLHVLDEAGTPIRGLFAAGEVIGAGTTTGNAFCGGMLLTPALTFGRRLGRSLGAAAAGTGGAAGVTT